MAKGISKLLTVALVGAGLFGAYRLGASLLSDDAETDSTRHVVNQVWVERMPESQRDMIAHLVVVEHPQGRFGVAGKASQWRAFIEGFVWKLEGHKLSVFFPQEETRAAFKVKTWRCEGDAPAPFQLCLEISRGRRSVTFYSRDDWKIEPHDATGSVADILEDTPALAGVLDTVAHEQPLDVEDIDLEGFTPTEALPID